MLNAQRPTLNSEGIREQALNKEFRIGRWALNVERWTLKLFRVTV
jgi:hypothetical protein